MTKRLHPGTLLLVAAFATACGEVGYYDDDDDRSNDPSNVGGWDGSQGVAASDAGAWDAAHSDAGSMPWDARFDAGSAGDAGSWDAAPSGWDASPAPDAGASGGWDASTSTDAATADAAAVDSGSAGNECGTLTYASFGEQFLRTYCLSCHGAVSPRGGVQLDSLSAILARKTAAKNAVASGAMPQGTNRPSNIERQRFGQWLDCGPN